MSRIVKWAKESHRFLSEDKRLGEAVQRFGPPQIRIRKAPFKLLVQSIAGQQLSGKAAATIFARTCELVGDVTPENLLRFTKEDLRSAGLSFAKASTLHAVSHAALDGLDFSRLQKLDDAEILRRLTAIRGIGPWTAEMFLIFALGRPDVMSPGDLGLRKGLQIVYRRKSLPEPKECAKLYEPWRPYRSAASWYLWRIVEGDNANW